jgi:hypothetical protein
MIRYEFVTELRNWFTCVALVATSAVVGWLSAGYSIAWALLLGYPIVWGWWCLITNRNWRTTVGEGLISWDPLFSRRRRTMAISDIAKIELYPSRDEGTLLYLRMANGKRRTCPARYEDQTQFISAVVAENPAIEVRYPPNAVEEFLSRALRAVGAWLGLSSSAYRMGVGLGRALRVVGIRLGMRK